MAIALFGTAFSDVGDCPTTFRSRSPIGRSQDAAMPDFGTKPTVERATEPTTADHGR